VTDHELGYWFLTGVAVLLGLGMAIVGIVRAVKRGDWEPADDLDD
jgi:hypothetical protein